MKRRSNWIGSADAHHVLLRVSGGAAVLLGAALLIRAAFADPPVAAPATQPALQNDKAQLEKLTVSIQERHKALMAAQAELVTTSLASPRDDAVIALNVKAITAAQLSLTEALSQAVAQSQRAAAIKANADRGRRISTIPDLTDAQSEALTQMAGALMQPTLTLSKARDAVTQIAMDEPADPAAMKVAIDAVSNAELALATTRADAFAKLQATPNKLADNQVTAFAAMGGILKLGGFSEPKPIDFNDHEGYTSLFDGVSLKGWDGNPKIWRVENGQIIGESTPQNPSGNTYLVYRDQQAKDFTLKFEIKIDGNGGSGMQYRSKTGIPWLAPVADNLQPVNLDWMMTGPQADFWPTQIYSGQFYSENTPMRIIAWRGQVVESNGINHKRLMGNIGNRKTLGDLENKNDWNQYTVIARSGTFIHIMNGQLMAVLVDDDPASSNNQSGLIGIEIESITKLYVRNVWLKKLN